MINPKVMEAWVTLMAEAMRGTKDAQDAFRSLTEMPATSDNLESWLARFMPSTARLAQPEAFETWLEEWWRMMGVVPRTRYLELLERCDTLQRRLEKAEETIQNLRSLLGSKAQQGEEARKIMDLWSAMLDETIKTQSEWMQSWMERSSPSRAINESEEGNPES